MSIELKACPFCGDKPRGIAGGYAACVNQSCGIFNVSVPVDEWNQWSAKKGLLVRVEKAEAIIERLIEAVYAGQHLRVDSGPESGKITRWYISLKRIADEWQNRG